MRAIRRACTQLAASVVVLLVFGSSTPSNAEEATQKPEATTTSNASIPIDQLRVTLRPLTKKELEIELQAWLELVKKKITEVTETELQLKLSEEEQPKAELKDRIKTLAKEERALVERTQVVINALKAKGGKVQAEEQYLEAVSDISQTTDATSYWAAIVAAVGNWAQREDGGKLWLRRFLWSVAVLLLFWGISRIAGQTISHVVARHSKTSTLLENFVRKTAGGTVWLIGILTALGVLGLDLGPLLAAVGASGLVIGLALQETLGSFASGLMIMVYRPFDVDDHVRAADVEGTVQEISLVSTTLLTFDHKVVVIPNKKAWGDTIINYTQREIRRVDLVFGIGYHENIQRVIDVLLAVATEHPLVLREPAVQIRVGELADSSVNLLCRPWVKTKDYWTVYWDLTHQVKDRFDTENISIPFPQRDIHMRDS